MTSSSTKWYEVGGCITGATFVGDGQLLVTSTLSDGVHLWQLPPSTSATSAAPPTVVKRIDFQQRQRYQISCLSSSSSSSSPSDLLCGTVSGELGRISLDNGGGGGSDGGIVPTGCNVESSFSSSSSNALIHISQFSSSALGASPSGGGSSALHLALSLGGVVSIVDCRAARVAFQSQLPSGGGGALFAATTLGPLHFVAATEGGNVALFDIRRLGSSSSSSQSSFFTTRHNSVRIFSLRNQVTCMCPLPVFPATAMSSSSAATTTCQGVVCGTVGGRVMTVRAFAEDGGGSGSGGGGALDDGVSSGRHQQQEQSSAVGVVRDEAIGMPMMNERFPVTHIAAVADSSPSNASSQSQSSNKNTLRFTISAAFSDGSVALFTKSQPATPQDAQRQRDGRDDDGSGWATGPEEWEALVWRLGRKHRPTAICLSRQQQLAAAFVPSSSVEENGAELQQQQLNEDEVISRVCVARVR